VLALLYILPLEILFCFELTVVKILWKCNQCNLVQRFNADAAVEEQLNFSDWNYGAALDLLKVRMSKSTGKVSQPRIRTYMN